ncbi:universal stress protein [Stella sp.]|uniref:universal stress protein n=1 Tax=Stella sp. TaxID=2912054 RepID=UPI0035B0BD93
MVFLEGDTDAGQRLAFAAALAERWGAHLVATFVARDVALDRHAGFAIGDGLRGMLDHHRAVEERERAAAAEAFARVADGRAITSEWRGSRNETGEALMLHARHADLAIVGPPRPDEMPTTVLGPSLDVIFASGRPTLLLPADWPPARLPGRVLVGWNASREAARAVADALPFLVAAEAVHLAVVPEPKIAGLLGADPGTDIARHLARHGVPVTVDRLAGADVGQTLLDHAERVAADLLVMGASGQSRISEFLFGGATRTILARARRPILLSR